MGVVPVFNECHSSVRLGDRIRTPELLQREDFLLMVQLVFAVYSSEEGLGFALICVALPQQQSQVQVHEYEVHEWR